MKRLYISAAILVVIAALCAVTLRFQQQTIHSLLGDLEKMESAYNRGDTAACLSLSQAFIEQYERRTETFLLFMDHAELSAALEVASTLPAILRQDDASHYPAELARCKTILQRLDRLETVTIENIL